ncbi:putative ribonucleotide reductase [Enterococcus phage ECP3]|uniref:Ribonucleotide reductase n=1 Tax=Enterococcus phage ECP3 TaxID=1498168 RepID=A0A096XT54_9CAUD|nr:putative ribonucleotide reductase [Enterococcus phage ECP3]AII28488.1 putative ribonucleotide reductase [Enterococcus phage ECP3]
MTKVTVYSKDMCGQCLFLKNMLNGKNIPFDEKNISHDEQALAYLKEKGVSSLPYVEAEDGFSFNGVRPDLVKKLEKELGV